MAPRSVTTWARLEPRTRDRELFSGLQAAVGDPLWLLGRQWQTGELAGEDAGSLVDASIEVRVDPMARFRPGSADGPDADTVYDEAGPTPPPLETLVEGERVGPSDAERKNLRAATEAGSHFLRLLGDDLALEAADFPASLHCEATDADGAGRRYSSVVAGRTLDGDDVRGAYDYPDEASFRAALADEDGDVPVPEGLVPDEFDPDDEDDDPSAFWDAFVAYREYYDERYHEPDADAASWRDDRLEYDFEVSTGRGEHETVFAAGEYEGGRLDWDDFEIDHDATLELSGADGPDSDVRVHERIPTPSRFKGMPAYRWWEIEDDGIDFSAVSAAPEDLSRLLMLEFGLVYGNDWFTVPLSQPTGSLAEVTGLTLETTFNELIEVEDAVDVDDDPTTDWNAYSFALSEDGDERGLFLPPVLVSALESDEVEAVTFGRDEMANVGWAIERTVEGTAGQPRDRRSETATDGTTSQPIATAEEAEVAYQLSTDVPENWFPLLPRRTDLGEVTLDRGRLFADGDDPPAPIGRLLSGELSIPEEEVPRRGKTVSRTYQYTRWTDGSAHLWSGRDARVSRGRTDSGLAFDQLVDSRVADDEPPVREADSMPEGEPISVSGQLIVAEVSPETPGGPRENLTEEYIVLENAGGGTLDLSGWRVEDAADHRFTFPDGSELAPGERATLRTGDGTDGDGEYFWGRGSQVWNDDGDVVSVYDDEGTLVRSYEYPELPANVQTGSLRVVEAQPDAPGDDWSNLDDEFVSFENDGGETLDLSSWRVTDAAGHEYVFPEGTDLPPGATIRLRTGEGTDTDHDVYWGSGVPVWNNTGDTISVYDESGELVLRKTY